MKPTTLLILLSLFVCSLVYAGDQLPNMAAAINGKVYCDQNKDGQCDCEEHGLKGVHIQVFAEHCGGIALQTIHTDDEGNFSFHIPEPGKYFVMVDLEYVCGGRVPTTKPCQEVELAAGETATLLPFGYTVTGQ